MNIRAVEQQTGLKKANIRYYGQEGLIAPANSGNSAGDTPKTGDYANMGQVLFMGTLEIVCAGFMLRRRKKDK